MKAFYLVPSDGRKSFYGKALVINDGGKALLRSYETIVAEYDEVTKQMSVRGLFSRTTIRHIKAFFKLYNMPFSSTKDIEKFIK